MNTVECWKVPGGYVQCPPDYATEDAGLDAMTKDSLAGDLVRLVANRKDNGTYSRTRRSAQLSGNLELGWAHMASKPGHAQELFTRIATRAPALAVAAWGPKQAMRMRDINYVDELLEGFRDQYDMPEGLEWVVGGWVRISKHPKVQRIYADYFWEKKVDPAIKLMKEKGWKKLETLGAAVRLSTTAPAWLRKLGKYDDEDEAREAVLEEYAASRSNRARRVKRLKANPAFKGPIVRWPKASDLRYGGSTARKVAAVGLGALFIYGASRYLRG